MILLFLLLYWPPNLPYYTFGVDWGQINTVARPFTMDRFFKLDSVKIKTQMGSFGRTRGLFQSYMSIQHTRKKIYVIARSLDTAASDISWNYKTFHFDTNIIYPPATYWVYPWPLFPGKFQNWTWSFDLICKSTTETTDVAYYRVFNQSWGDDNRWEIKEKLLAPDLQLYYRKIE